MPLIQIFTTPTTINPYNDDICIHPGAGDKVDTCSKCFDTEDGDPYCELGNVLTPLDFAPDQTCEKIEVDIGLVYDRSPVCITMEGYAKHIEFTERIPQQQRSKEI